MASASRRCSGRPAAARLPRAAATQPTEQPINSARSPATAAVETHRPASFNATSVATPAPRPRSDRPPRDTYRTPPRHGYCAAPISGTAASRWPRERRSGRAPSRPTRTWPVEGSANSQSPHTDPGISQVRRIVISGWRGIRVPSAAMARRARDRAAFALLHLGGQQRLEVTYAIAPLGWRPRPHGRTARRSFVAGNLTTGMPDLDVQRMASHAVPAHGPESSVS